MSLAKDIPVAGIKIPTYILCTDYIYNSTNNSNNNSQITNFTTTTKLTPLQTTIAGAISGGITAFCTMPFDAVNTWAKAVSSPNSGITYLSIIKRIYKHGGVKAFFTGTSLRVCNFILGSSLFWLFFDTAQRSVLNIMVNC